MSSSRKGFLPAQNIESGKGNPALQALSGCGGASSNLFPVVYFVKFKCILCSLNISLIVNASKKENVLLLRSAKHHFESSATLISLPKSRRHLTASDYNEPGL